ncbi:MAG: ferrochelatase [Polyangiales bacterium]
MTAYDAILYLSFGGPEGPDDVMPFLENVTRGKRVPEERLREVESHYLELGGKSPINDQNAAFVGALKSELDDRGIDLPIYVGNRNWKPYLADTVSDMRNDGIKQALCFVTSAFSSYSGCRQYLENIDEARATVGEGAPIIDKIRSCFNHPRFVQAAVDRLTIAASKLSPEDSERAVVVFTAHSLPTSMSQSCDYEAQLKDICAIVSESAGMPNYRIAYQSRSGPPQMPWLEPDILDALQSIIDDGLRAVIVMPIGFLSDHMEVVWDLDREAFAFASRHKMRWVRAATVGTHPVFVSGVADMIEERLGTRTGRAAVGHFEAKPDVCAPDCCARGAEGASRRP